MANLHEDIERVVFSAEDIAKRVAELGEEIAASYSKDDKPLVVGVLTGACIFLSDIARSTNMDMELDFIKASSYGDGTESRGSVQIIKDLSTDPMGRHIIIVEDIVDTGLTLLTLQNLFASRGAKSVRICTLLNKKERRAHDVKDPEFVGFECPNEFLVGYGLDFAGKYRNLPYIGVLKKSVYSSD